MKISLIEIKQSCEVDGVKYKDGDKLATKLGVFMREINNGVANLYEEGELDVLNGDRVKKISNDEFTEYRAIFRNPVKNASDFVAYKKDVEAKLLDLEKKNIALMDSNANLVKDNAVLIKDYEVLKKELDAITGVKSNAPKVTYAKGKAK